MDHMEMARLAQSPGQIRVVASTIKAALGQSISPSENDFLSKLERFSEDNLLSVRQREFLWSLRERTSRKPVQGKYRAAYLIQKLWEARADLQYEDEEKLERFRAFGQQLSLSKSEWRWVFARCRELNLIDDEYVSLT
ncbi:MAG: hypothetical protein K2X41_00645 [Hyphomicrobium sp.]|nr:hypothetical protein [Hyphomicrobium sp.]